MRKKAKTIVVSVTIRGNSLGQITQSLASISQKENLKGKRLGKALQQINFEDAYIR